MMNLQDGQDYILIKKIEPGRISGEPIHCTKAGRGFALVKNIDGNQIRINTKYLQKNRASIIR